MAPRDRKEKMTPDIQNIVSCGENSRVQFKEEWTSSKQIAAELIAFANSKGGELYIGIEDKTGEITGLSYEEIQTISREIGNIANEQIRPALYVQTETLTAEDKQILVVHIDEGRNKPYKDLQGTIWVKQGADKRRVTENSEILRLFQDAGAYYPDQHAVLRTGMNDLDERLIDAYIQKKSATVDATLPKEQLLRNMQITDENGCLTMGGLLFFGKNPQMYMPSMVIKAVAFYGNSIGGTQYRDSKDFSGTIPQMYEQGLAFLKNNLHAVQSGQNFNTLGILEIPQIALEELLQNALVHRDYLTPAPIRLLIFDNRVEIINPCHLGRGMSVETILRGATYQCNPLLAKFCEEMMIYRGLGSGIRRALAEFPELEITYREDCGDFIVTLQRKTETDGEKDGKMDVQIELTDRQMYILRVIQHNETITIPELARKTKISVATMNREIKKMQDLDILARVEGRRMGHWVIKFPRKRE